MKLHKEIHMRNAFVQFWFDFPIGDNLKIFEYLCETFPKYYIWTLSTCLMVFWNEIHMGNAFVYFWFDFLIDSSVKISIWFADL